MTGKHHLYIIEVGGQLYLQPDIPSIDVHGTATVRNLSNRECRLTFNPPGPLAGGGTVVDVPAGSKGTQIPLDPKSSGFFTFKLLRREGDAWKAIKHRDGSAVPPGDPGMIIDP